MPLESVNGSRSPEEGGWWAGDKQRKCCEESKDGCNEVASWPGRGEQGPMKKPSSGGLLSQQPESGA